MAINANSLTMFTNQYQLSKTLRFELKPVGRTAEWIKKHNIIGIEKGEAVGVDADRATNYKYAKQLLNELHRQFIEEALELNPKDDSTKALQDEIVELYAATEIKGSDLPATIFKQILDEKANEWINLYQYEMPECWKNEFEAKIRTESDEKKKKYLSKSLSKIIKKCEEQPFKKSGVEVLYGSNEDPIKLLEWVVRKEKIRPTFGDIKHKGDQDAIMPKECIIKYIIRSFDNFSTYFTGFNENRANVYDVTGTKSTSLIYRIFVQNMQFHFDNIRKWETIKKSLEKYAEAFTEKNYDWQSKLSECEENLSFSIAEILTPEAFVSFINQSGIDRYNEIVGGMAQEGGKTKIQGINEFINLARQQANAKRNEFPPLQFLYKQILSKSDKTFISTFESDEEMFGLIKDFHQENFVDHEDGKESVIQEFVKGMGKLIYESLDDKSAIFISKDKLTSISQELTGAWNTISNRLLSELGEKIFTQSEWFSIQQIDDALNAIIDGEKFSSQTDNIKVEYQSQSGNILLDFLVNKLESMLTAINASWNELIENGVLNDEKLDGARENEGEKGFEQIAAIKSFLDCSIGFMGFVKNWMLQGKKFPEEMNKVWQEAIQQFCDQFQIIKLYNMVRNHVTKKAYSDEKLKINFNNSTLLDGWDRNKESSNYGIILEKGGLYFLGIMTPKSNNIFDYEIADSCSLNKKKEKQELANEILCSNNESTYRKMNYKLLPGPNKMLPKVFFATKNREIFKPSQEIITIKEQKLYNKAAIEKNGKHDLYAYIDFCKISLSIHPEWSKAFGFSETSFRKTSEYNSIDEFYKDVEILGYKLSFDNIKQSYIDEKVTDGELYLFQIYSKDFSQHKKGTGNDNLHTSYWKLLFDEENRKDTVLKLNGQAEIFFRQASIKLTDEKRSKGHHYEELKGKFAYPIIKDRRFTEDKFFFHCPIGMNFKAPSIAGRFNDKVNTFLRNNPDVRIIGIDRGEKHLLYYSVIDRNGKIVEQGSLNTIAGFNGSKIDYHQKLNEKEANRDKARKSWSVIENIKELKAGYLSQVVHKLAQLIIKYNAIVVLEDLNHGFKRGRFKVEKQVYQKFEKALIDKLNYLVFKDKTNRVEFGHYLNAYQLTNQFQSFEKLGKQSGILFYTTASYTSTTDPVSGFLKNVYVAYESIEKSIKFIESFDSIIYNSGKDRFEFTYTLGKIASKSVSKEKEENKVNKTQWTICSCVERSSYNHKTKTHELHDINQELKDLFKDKIDCLHGHNLCNAICQIKEKEFLEKFIRLFNAIMTIRVTDSSKASGTDKNDFILSPVEPFFDSRKAGSGLPENGDANGAYNIARKGICILNKIDAADDISKINPAVTKLEWQNFVQ